MGFFSVVVGEERRTIFRLGPLRSFLSARRTPWPKVVVQEKDARTLSRHTGGRELTRSLVAAPRPRVYPPGARKAVDAGVGDERGVTQAPPTEMARDR